jgi:hypothetical protein
LGEKASARNCGEQRRTLSPPSDDILYETSVRLKGGEYIEKWTNNF